MSLSNIFQLCSEETWLSSFQNLICSWLPMPLSARGFLFVNHIQTLLHLKTFIKSLNMEVHMYMVSVQGSQESNS